MSLLYVHALTAAPIEGWTEHGRRFESVPVGVLYAVAERRRAAPPVTEEELQRQHATVIRIWERAPSVVPARFGSLLDEAELNSLVREHGSAFKEALALVAGKAQMTVRVAVGQTRPSVASRARSGRAYLEGRRRTLSPPLPPAVETALASVARYVVSERRKGTGNGAAAVYHLIGRSDVDAYGQSIGSQLSASLTVTGPWPPFAFAPDLW